MSSRKPTKIDTDDPRFTAHALDELGDVRACREIEALLSRSADARRALEDIREGAAKLREELAQEPMPVGSEAEQEALQAQVQIPPSTRRRWWRRAGGLAAAAAGFLAVALSLPQQRSFSNSVLTVPSPSKVREPSLSALADVPSGSASRAALGAQPVEALGGKVEAELDEAMFGEDQRFFLGEAGGVPAYISSQPMDSLIEGRDLRVASGAQPAPETFRTRFVDPRSLNSSARGRALAPSASPPIPAPTLGRDIPRAYVPFNTEAYDRVEDNPFLDVRQNPLSTFSIDVDTASYANVRRFINSGRLPPKDAVRIEAMINYFHYDDPQPDGEAPFSVSLEVAPAPWMVEHQLLRIGLKGAVFEMEDRPPSNLVFLLDVSGSMRAANKLPLVKKSIALLVEKLGERDRVAIVVYAGASGLALPSTSCD